MYSHDIKNFLSSADLFEMGCRTPIRTMTRCGHPDGSLAGA
jgi:hypothetical protein